jgi:radical SAM superfamily enzyme YgiQ (UPF0313 family)
VRFLDLMAAADWRTALGQALAAFTPEVIGISIRNIDDQDSRNPRFLLEEAREVVAYCKANTNAPVVLGGAGYSIFPEQVLKYTGADMGIQGEGEAAFIALLSCLAADAPLSGVPGLYIRGHGLQAPRIFCPELDQLPLPDPDLFDRCLAENPATYLPVQTRRGCPLHCSYCSTPTIEGTRIRKRAPERVVASLTRWRAAGFRQAFFVDNVFNLPPGYARELCEHIIAAGLDIAWRCILYPGHVGEDLVQAMARAGCREVSLGFESGSQPMLDTMHKRFHTGDVRRASRLLADHGIRRMGFLMLGGPGETRKSVEESLRFADALALDAVKITVGVRIYPHTELARIAMKEGLIGAGSDLLYPHFYIVPGLDAWLRETVRSWMAERPHWML